ncbi:hypothetical protein ThidrDRAFT_4133 [Thiorhodococcus drewsii AZ1]|uniref:Uncharacterized protein n=1 Tax=Thiorhodococcus drewsii AZ1 TaxID=765913 RepID=G2E770_9GAMM|nr:hypothetical protein [Thiorhodococcus drewsii]EGV28037.1 hypothetical protein ThidrDRAFT_4133 [Thiorhodococcus drewsii AZ1]
MAARRNRCVKLDAEKVRSYARRLGVESPQQLEVLYRKRIHVPETMSVGVVRKAWNGECVDKEPARKLAACLGLDDFLPLLQTDPEISPWGRLMADASLRAGILKFVPAAETDLRLVRLESGSREDGLPRVSLNTAWFLLCSGRRDQEVFLLIRSRDRFVQLAPLDGAHFVNRFEGRELRYPAQGNLEFESADGTGWRQFVAVRAHRIPMPLRGPLTGYDLTLSELDQLALRLLTPVQGRPEELAVDTFDFVLDR